MGELSTAQKCKPRSYKKNLKKKKRKKKWTENSWREFQSNQDTLNWTTRFALLPRLGWFCRVRKTCHATKVISTFPLFCRANTLSSKSKTTLNALRFYHSHVFHHIFSPQHSWLSMPPPTLIVFRSRQRAITPRRPGASHLPKVTKITTLGAQYTQ